MKNLSLHVELNCQLLKLVLCKWLVSSVQLENWQLCRNYHRVQYMYLVSGSDVWSSLMASTREFLNAQAWSYSRAVLYLKQWSKQMVTNILNCLHNLALAWMSAHSLSSAYSVYSVWIECSVLKCLKSFRSSPKVKVFAPAKKMLVLACLPYLPK